MSTQTLPRPSSASTPASSTSGVREVSPQEVSQWLARGECVLVDVREPDEHAREHIPGAKLLPLSKFDVQQLRSLVRPGQKLVLHCKSGKRSADACRMASSLSASGIDVMMVTGGIEAWKQANLQTVLNTSVSGISVMRQVQLVIGLCVLTGSALAYFVNPLFIIIPAFFGAGLTFAGATGTCALASLIARMPWNRAAGAAPVEGASCCSPGKSCS